MKKKNLAAKGMAMLMACGLLIGNTGIVAHAETYDDGCVRSDRDAGGGDGSGANEISLGGGSSSSSGNSGGSSSSGGGSSYDDGCARSDREAGGGDGSGANEISLGGSSTASAPAGLSVKGNTLSVAGYETFRQINSPANGRVAIYHCGIEQYTAQLKDADGNAAAYKSAVPYKDEATGKWYMNLTTEDGTKTKGWTVGTYKGSVTYLPKLGMSGVMLNQVVVVDAEAEAAASK